MSISAQQFIFVIALTALLDGSGDANQPTPSVEDQVIALLDEMHRPDISGQEMLDAERALTAIRDVTAVRPMFEYFARIHVPWSPGGYGDSELDAQFLDGNATHLFEARRRVWRHIVQHAEPIDERQQIIEELFDEWDQQHEFFLLLGATTWNRNIAIEDRVWKFFSDRDMDPVVREHSARALVTIANIESPPRAYQHGRRVIEYVWEERGSNLATNLGGRLSFRHPDQRALKLDWFDRERTVAARRGTIPAGNINAAFDSYFQITETPRFSPSQIPNTAEHRQELQEAMQAGDPRVREMTVERSRLVQKEREAFLANQHEAVTAWIAENRERLEQEAEEYAEQRARELERQRERAGTEQ